MLLSYEEVPEWYQDNPYIRHGYRPVSHSTAKCLWSWTYLHNESLNIFTHLIPAVVAVVGGSIMLYLFVQHYPLASRIDLIIFAFFLLSVLACFGMSVGYHTLGNHSREVCYMAVRCDYVGILVLTLGDFASGIRMSFFCEPEPSIIYWTMIGSLGVLSAIILLNPRLQSQRHRKLRLAAFLATGTSALAPIMHGIIMFGFLQYNRQSGLMYYLVELLSLLVGAIFYSTRIPECLAPGKFDIFGSSHQIFHVLVVFATTIHVLGLYEAYRYNYTYRPCGLDG